jgi:tetratricopeptide (TPR) repeat protein
MKNSAQILFIIFLFASYSLGQQVRSENLRHQGQVYKDEGRYREAIDQFNKFISANPQLAVGYHLRGLCYEKTTEYQYSVLDLRRARRLEPANEKIQQDLARVISIWHEQLYKKIEGHKRDIAIDPNYAFSYLEIGKSYRWLEEWANAEIWYDEYLKRDDNASPDEIIRYTEILAKTGSITKGEKILKKYVERYPEDWRLWSRYGYFTLWLDKYKIAEDAFTKALGFKPFFKEAEDGLDIVRNQAYLALYQPRAFERVYPIDRYYSILKRDPENPQIRYNLISELITANRYSEAYDQLQLLQATNSEDDKFKEYWKAVTTHRDSVFTSEINQYTELLKQNPTDKESVIKLATAYANLYYYDSAIEILSEYLEDVPKDQDLDARFMLAKFAAWNYEWEKAIAELNNLLSFDPNNLDYQLLRGQIAVWTVLDFDIGEKYLRNVITNRPNELSAYISLASLYSWQKNFPEARKYLDIANRIAPNSSEVESAESNYALHLSAYEELLVFEIKAEAGRLAADGNCVEAKSKYEEYFSKRTAPTRDELIEYADIVTCAEDYPKAIGIYDKLLADEFDYRIALYRARNYYYNKDSLLAVTELEALQKLKPDDRQTELFLADAYAITDQPYKAEEIYRRNLALAEIPEEINMINERFLFLSESFIKNNDLEKAKNLLDELSDKWEKSEVDKRKISLSESFINSRNLEQARELLDNMSLETTDRELINEINKRRFYLADAYAIKEDYSEAEELYNYLLKSATDTSEVRIIKQRLSWIPPYGFSGGISRLGNILSVFIPTNIGFAPFSNYYRDNQNLKFWNYGFRIDAGMLGMFSLGGVWTRTNIDAYNNRISFTSLKGTLGLSFLKYGTITANIGTLSILGENRKWIGDLVIKAEIPDVFSLSAYYDNNDARLLLYSPTLIYTRYKAELYRISGYYQHRNVLRLSSIYSYYELSDKNKGNDFTIRIGRMFFERGFFGYEFFFSDFAFISPIYYSPQDFISHSIWGEYSWQFDKNFKFKIGGKVGYVPDVDFVVSEIFGDINYNPFLSLNINARIGYSNSFRYDTGYRAFSGAISAYWSIY